LLFDAIFAAYAALDKEPDGEEKIEMYTDFIMQTIPEDAQRDLEELMRKPTERYGSSIVLKYVNQGKAEGLAEGKAEALLRLLEHRDVPVPADVRERIAACADPAQLDAWFDLAFSVATARELFE
jgi:hypothetical protein